MSQTDNAKSALLVMVHGSPTANANEPMYAVVEVLRRRGVYPVVEIGFMECNEPSIPDAIARCVAQGAARIDAVAYFLHVGTHVADDLPRLLEEGRSRYPDIEFRMGPYLGESPLVGDLLASRAASALQDAEAAR